MRQIVSGYRLFKCDNCLLEVKWPCRDSHTPSGEDCPECQKFIYPVGSEEHPEWPTDKFGNLTYEQF